MTTEKLEVWLDLQTNPNEKGGTGEGKFTYLCANKLE